ncbi:mitochondrial 54S ribosomal protein bL32m [Lodderomyces beijingensis]|uniref:Large ribosomal subunit protein bL32m n=1 Tax=Lodderomyces beijingensis TaxID=1775926 RepID=A0ABP0ZJJ7_9ASCO
MSLALRSWGLFSLQETVLGAIPRLPSISFRWGASHPSPRACQHHHDHHEDQRLSELQEWLENSNNASNPPFMIDNGAILKAAPKKRSSYMRKRIKLYMPGNKQIKPLFNIVRCPACGAAKRSHFMCMNCFGEIRAFLKRMKRADGVIKDQDLNPQKHLDPVDERIIYPGKYTKHEERLLRKKDWVPQREESPLFSKEHMVKQKRSKSK